jgi:hypothetical protein
MTIPITRSTDRITVATTTIMLYGPPGLRKTSMGYTADAPLLLDFDKGAHRAFGRKDTVRCESWATVADMTEADLAEYRTIVVDTVGRCLDMMAADIIKKNPKMQVAAGALSLQGYGVLKGAFATWMGWLASLGKDVVLIAHDREDKKAEELIFRADIQGSSHGEVFKRADGVAYVHTVNRATILDFSPTDRWLGKNPGRFEPFVVPDFGTDRSFLAGVITQVKDALNRMSEEQQHLVEQIDEWSTRATEATCADEINGLVTLSSELKPPLGPQVKHIIAARAKELDLVYEGPKGKGKFVDPAPEQGAAE